jgi:DNA-binding transcriptional MocR family regulator
MNTIWQPEIAEGPGPKYRAVAQAIRGAVAQRQLTIGERLPPVRELAWRLGITPGTVARAYSVLTEEGLLHAGVGRGTFVAEPAPPPDDTPYVPIEIDAVPHNSPVAPYRVNLFSPVLPSIGQAALIQELLAQVARAPASGVMHYPSRAGTLPARRAALQWLSDCPLGEVGEDDIVLTAGGQHGIQLVMQAVLTGRRPAVLIEELAYPGFRRAAELLRAEVVPVAMDEHGLIPEALERAARGCDAQVLCTSPEAHNPTATNTPIERREALVRVARANGIQIVEDDCYRMGTARGPSYRQLAPDLGWYVSSVAKTLTPALRLGFAVAPRGRASALRRAKEHGMFGLPTPMIDLAALLLADPRVTELTTRARDTYAGFIDLAVETLQGYDLRYSRDVPFLWLTLPKGWRASTFCQAAEAADVPVRSAEEFSGREAQSPHAVRLAINAGVGRESFAAAMKRLRLLLDNPAEQILV